MAAEQVTLYRISPSVTNEAVNMLFAAAWPDYILKDFEPILSRSLAYICAFQGDWLVGFVNLAWDGGIHAFLLDTTVHPDVRRRGIGQQRRYLLLNSVAWNGCMLITSRTWKPFTGAADFNPLLLDSDT